MSTVIGRVQIAETTAIAAGRLVVFAPRWKSGTVTVRLLDRKDEPVQSFYAELKLYKD
ncbi:MAG: hypothetical protein H3C34_27525, partial [Caldilineaceae bacterium]|nr:hypothetical protein [Caldilineaceae bacterium]